MKEIIAVVGSSNTDLVFQTPKFPQPGETVLGGKFATFAGGKGANQAVAAARLGGDVYFIARVGDDGFGNEAIKGFLKDTINTEFVFKDKDFPTGVASIVINEKGQNSIVVAPGANNHLTPKNIDTALSAIEKSSIVLVQLEISLETVKYVINKSFSLKKRVILNPAPAQQIEESLYSKIFLITPNETETELLTGIKVVDEFSASIAATILLNKGVENVIITLGEKGSFFKNKEEEFMVAPKKVAVVDTTAAGDIFNGAIAVALSEGENWKEAILFANSASAIGVSRLGAQASIPYKSELE
ncbi:ribokinase [uncultured Lutibacter sp.]|uniref:ribokinase n=1 Tax=uncultured Lutibacter sp. TaxID=437739 RepID=UPI002606B24C|nr:ribokinase [uncultured Lutibacter sp.]